MVYGHGIGAARLDRPLETQAVRRRPMPSPVALSF